MKLLLFLLLCRLLKHSRKLLSALSPPLNFLRKRKWQHNRLHLLTWTLMRCSGCIQDKLFLPIFSVRLHPLPKSSLKRSNFLPRLSWSHKMLNSPPLPFLPKKNLNPVTPQLTSTSTLPSSSNCTHDKSSLPILNAQPQLLPLPLAKSTKSATSPKTSTSPPRQS